MSKKRRSLADDLTELFNPAPAPELDPENAGVELPLLAPADDEFERHAKPTKAAKEKGFRLRGDIQLHDTAYTGRKVSRAEVFGEDDAPSSGGDADEDEEDDDADEASSKEGGEGSEEDEVAGGGERGGKEDAASAGDGNGEEHADGADHEEEDMESDHDEQAAAERRASGAEATTSDEDGSGSDHNDIGPRAAAGGEVQQLEEEYRQLQEVERSAMEGLKERAQKERQKGRAVAAQQRLYERALEARILLQKCVAGGNVLPRAGAELRGVLACSASLRGSYSQLRSEAHETLTALLNLHAALAANNPAVAQAAAASPGTANGSNANGTATPPAAGGGQKRRLSTGGLDTLDIAWEAFEAQFAAVAAFRDASLDRWHRRTMLATGGAALKGGGLRALHQSVSSQVANMVRDSAKAVKRARLTLTARPRVLCALPDATNADTASAPAGEEGTASASEAREAGGEEAQDPETFDDAEFYQQLLKELIDSSSGAGGAAGGAGYKGQKKRKNVDRRASKGRKIRYHVHEKLVNFMVPVESELPVFAGQLFSNLFGRATA